MTGGRSTRPLLSLLIVLLLVGACGGPGGTARPAGPGGSPGAGAGSPGAGGGSPGAGATADAGGSPGASPGASAAAPTPTPAPTASVGCGEGGSSQLTVGERSQAGGADEIAYTRYQAYCDANPDVQVIFTNRTFDRTTFLLDVQAGTAADVVRMDRAFIGTYIAAGALDPLDQCIADHQIDITQYYEPAIAQVTWEDQVYGIPEFYETRLVLVNDSVVQDAGLSADDLDTSDWDALRAVNDQLMAKEGGLTRIGFDPKINDFLPMWARANGASVISDDGLTAQLDDPKVAEALDYAASLVLAHGSSAEFFDFRKTWDPTFFGKDNPFVQDQVGAFPMEAFYLNVLASNSPDEEVTVLPFRGRDGSEITFATGSTWAIPTNSQNKEQACEFMKVVTSPDAWVAAAQARAEIRANADPPQAFTGTYSGNRVADERIFSEVVTEQSAGRFYEGVQLAFGNLENAFALPAIPCGGNFDTAWREAVRRVLEEGISAADALADAQVEAQDAIDAGAAGQPCP